MSGKDEQEGGEETQDGAEPGEKVMRRRVPETVERILPG